MKQFRGADALAQTLQRAGVKHIFALSGNHIMPLFDALFDTGIELIHTRHEAACVHMADAYARLTGRAGIALVTGGPGHANALGALYTAQMSEAPVVLLSGHAPNDQIGRGSFQEMRQVEMAAPVTKASWVAASADSLSSDIARALREAASGRPGPVHLSLPTDALEHVAAQDAPANNAETVGGQWSSGNSRCFSAVPMPLAAADAESVLAWLGAARRPLILAGPACLTRAGRARLLAFEQASGIPVIGMESPRGINDPALGGFAEMLAQADRVLLIGKKVDFTLKFGQGFDAACELMQIDADQPEIARARKAFGARLKFTAQADAFSALDSLCSGTGAGVSASSGGRRSSVWLDEVRAAIGYRPSAWDSARASTTDRIHPVQACRPLQTILDSHPDAILVSDGGEFGQWAQACLDAPNRVINGPAGAIGAALPFALGARVALPAKTGAPIIALMGDGTFGFHSAEFDTAVRHKLPFVLIVGNDARWNAEYQIQLKSYGAARLHACELLPARYDQVAIAFGGHGELVTQAEQLMPAVARAIAAGLPACVNVMIEGVPAPLVKRD